MNETGRVVLIIVLVLVALPVLWGSAMMWGMGPGMMSSWGESGRWDVGSWLMVVVPVLLILGAVTAALAWTFWGGPSTSNSTGHPRAREILDERYVRGELTREQYRAMRADLDS